jgi:hypothetical protein
MFEIETPQTRLSDPQDEEVTQYQAVSGLAVAGLIAGLLAPAALAHPLLWIAPLVGILLCALALNRIRREAPVLVGRKLALVGLMLSMLCGAAAPSEWLAHQWIIDAEARRFARVWFEFLRADEPLKAIQLEDHGSVRRPLDDSLAKAYPPGSEARQALLTWVGQPEVRALLALRDRADVRYYDTEERSRAPSEDFVKQVYAVTYDEAGQKKSFFVRLFLERDIVADEGRAYWRVLGCDGGIRPKALGGE